MPLDWYWHEKRTAATRDVRRAGRGARRRASGAIGPRSRRRAMLIIGPEGGWAVSEVAAAHDSGAILMSLGARTLRADAVPIVALTALLTTWGELR